MSASPLNTSLKRAQHLADADQLDAPSASSKQATNTLVKKGKKNAGPHLHPPEEDEDHRGTRIFGLCLTVVAGWGVGFAFLRWSMRLVGTPLTRAAILSGIVIILIAAPFVVFLTKQWYVRRDEFRNRLSDGALLCYLERYWLRRACQLDFCEAIDVATGNVSAIIRTSKTTQGKAEKLFQEIYQEQYGLWAFFTPFVLVLIVTFTNAVLISWLWGCTRGEDGPDRQCLIFGVNHSLALAAIAGAYMFAVGDAVTSVRQNRLNVADVYWYALRLVIALPLGVAAGKAGGSIVDPTLVAFGLGALPVEELKKLLRRTAIGHLQRGDARQAPDQLLSLEGVTVRTSAILAAEGIASIAQLQSKDPVLLAVRTGLEFDFILYLISQAVVRRHLGANASALVPVGLIEAQAIRQLVTMLADDKVPDRRERAESILSDAAKRLATVANADRSIIVPGNEPAPREQTVQSVFEQIAEAPMTVFLSHVAPRGYRIREHTAEAPPAN
jgi:hypothetical protein